MIRAIVTDIEGTTSSIDFVHQVLFPYSAKALPRFVRQHRNDPTLAPWLAAVAADGFVDIDDTESLIAVLLGWIDEDRKHTALKAIQGLIWERGYVEGEFSAHVYPDVAPRLREWVAAGLKLYVYSSGSIAAQKLFFAHSEAGDLTPLFSGYFDTTSGPKRAADSYRQIAGVIGLASAELLFLSDIEAELDAAAEAGWSTTLLVRQAGSTAASAHRVVGDFSQIHPQ